MGNQANHMEEYLSRVIIDPFKWKISLYSDRGSEKVVDFDNMNTFLDLVQFVREEASEDVIEYASPI
jgi:hypothetical protein